MASQRSKGLLLGLLAAGLVAAPLGWFGSDHLEQDNDFCNACHLEPGVPLHIQIREDFDTRPVANLAGLHAAVRHPQRPASEPFRCIDCHGGVGFVGRARTKLLAAKDGFWWAVGHFEEPKGMRWPLWDQDCQQCHPDFREAVRLAASSAADPPFHGIDVHNVELGVGCVECHVSHGTGGQEDLYHLHPTQVRRQCAGCHTEFE